MDKKIRKAVCHCVNCGKKGYNHDFIMVMTFNSKRSYYCSKECQNSMTETQKMKADITYSVIDIIGDKLHYGKRAQTFVNKKIAEYEAIGQLDKLHHFMYRKLIEIKCKISFKEFDNAFQKVAYVFAIIDSELRQEILDKKLHESRIVQNTEEIEVVPDKKLKGGKDISGLIGIL